MTFAFSASGWINTEASGSINTASVSASAAGAVAGYQVWRFNDDLHNTGGKPVFVKVEYGSPYSPSAGRPGIWLSVGFTHNNSGSILSVNNTNTGVTPRLATITGAGAVSTRYTHRLCCISGSDMIGIIRETVGDIPGIFLVERTKDKNGNSTGDGIILSVSGYRNDANVVQYLQTYLPYQLSSSFRPATENILNYISSNTQTSFDNKVPVSMILPMLNSNFGYPSKMLGIVRSGVLTQDNTYTIITAESSSIYFVSANNAFLNQASDATYTRIRGRIDATNFRWVIRSE
jgi:hypothetical protein